MRFSITHKDVTASTNDDVWSLANQGAPEGVVVVARSQKQGRGQWGRVWVSPKGGLYFSFLLRPTLAKSEWPVLSPAIARAVCRALRGECGVEPDNFVEEQVPPESGHDAHRVLSESGRVVHRATVSVLHANKETEVATANTPQDLNHANKALPQSALSAEDMPALAQSIRVKHPNDVVCDAGKICGISLEARGDCVVVGCGVNVFPPSNPVETDGRNKPAYLFDLAPLCLAASRTDYLDALLDVLLAAIDQQLSSLSH